MKTLIVTHHYLDSPGGGCFASRAFINAFAEISNECVLLYPDNGEPINSYINKKVHSIGVKNKTSSIGKLLDIYQGKINRFYHVLFPTIKEYQPDIVVFDNSRTSAGYMRKLRKKGIKVVIIHHNFEMEYYKGSPPNLMWRLPFMHHMKKTEKEAILNSNINLTLTPQDASSLQRHYDPLKQSVFNCVGMFEFKPFEKYETIEYESGNDVLTFAITGNLGDYQTEVSLVPFIEEYYPILKKCFPNTKLIIAGKDPSDRLRQICNQHSEIELVPNPENMAKVIGRASIYICPVSVGGGIKLRVMDGLKLGLPVLTHKVSARGYDMFEKAGCLFVYDDIQSFEKMLLNVVEQPNKETVESMYQQLFSLESGVKRIKHIFIEQGIC